MQTLKNKIISITCAIALIFGLLTLVAPADAFAQAKPVGCKTVSRSTCCKRPDTQEKVAYCASTNRIVKVLKDIVNFLAAGIGIAIMGSVIFGGIQYATAGNNPTAVTAAKKRITNALLALLVFVFMYAFLQWILPGGIIFR